MENTTYFPITRENYLKLGRGDLVKFAILPIANVGVLNYGGHITAEYITDYHTTDTYETHIQVRFHSPNRINLGRPMLIKGEVTDITANFLDTPGIIFNVRVDESDYVHVGFTGPNNWDWRVIGDVSIFKEMSGGSYFTTSSCSANALNGKQGDTICCWNRCMGVPYTFADSMAKKEEEKEEKPINYKKVAIDDTIEHSCIFTDISYAFGSLYDIEALFNEYIGGYQYEVNLRFQVKKTDDLPLKLHQEYTVSGKVCYLSSDYDSVRETVKIRLNNIKLKLKEE